VRNLVFPGHARPSGSKLSVLFRQSYALSSVPGAGRLWSKPSSPLRDPELSRPSAIDHSPRVHATLVMVAFDVVDQFVSPLRHPAAQRLLPAMQTLRSQPGRRQGKLKQPRVMTWKIMATDHVLLPPFNKWGGNSPLPRSSGDTGPAQGRRDHDQPRRWRGPATSVCGCVHASVDDPRDTPKGAGRSHADRVGSCCLAVPFGRCLLGTPEQALCRDIGPPRPGSRRRRSGEGHGAAGQPSAGQRTGPHGRVDRGAVPGDGPWHGVPVRAWPAHDADRDAPGR
jgi:hypothetical protein